MGQVITYKSRLNRAGQYFYIYVPKAWNAELQKIYKNRKRVKVIIEVDD